MELKELRQQFEAERQAWNEINKLNQGLNDLFSQTNHEVHKTGEYCLPPEQIAAKHAAKRNALIAELAGKLEAFEKAHCGHGG